MREGSIALRKEGGSLAPQAKTAAARIDGGAMFEGEVPRTDHTNRATTSL